MKAVFAVSALFAASSAQHMIYEPHPEGHQIREPGAYGQDCTPQSGDYPDKCPKVGMLKESTHGKIECIHNFDCCLCGEMICGPDCTDIICNGDSGCFGVKNIKMIGDKTYGASLNCNGDLSCMGTYVDGINIGELYCTGDGACAFSKFNLDCIIQHGMGCELQCVGDNSCEGDPTDPRKIGYYNIKNSHGMSCSHDSCRTATYQLTSNVGGAINCNGQESCLGADITINNVESVFCGGIQSCEASNMLIMNPQNYFYIACTGPKGCVTLTMEIMVTNPQIDFIESISCMSADACKGASITVYKQRASAQNPLRIGEISCGAAGSCSGTIFDFGPHVIVEHCECAPGACDGMLGIPGCTPPPTHPVAKTAPAPAPATTASHGGAHP